MTRWLLGICLLIAFLCCALPVWAHHSFGAEYDANKPITLTGSITKIEWTNPHSYIFMDVTDNTGKAANWKFEGYGPGILHRIGWNKDVTMKPGDRITIFGWRARDGSNWAHSREITLPSGKKMMFGPPSGTGDGGATPAVDVH